MATLWAFGASTCRTASVNFCINAAVCLPPTHPMSLNMRHLSLLACACVACVGAARADDVPSVTPYRPSVSTPAALSAPGWLEAEVGVVSSQGDDPARRQSMPFAIKLAFTPDWGIRVGSEGVFRQKGADGSVARGAGDTVFVLKRRLAVDDATAFGLEAGVKLPTARSTLGSGHTDTFLNGIFSSDFAPAWHVDLNAWITHLGGADSGQSSWQQGWAAALSRNLTERWGVVAELSGTDQRGSAHTGLALAATSYSVSPGLTVDLGVSKGLNSASGGWSVFTGATFLVARLF